MQENIYNQMTKKELILWIEENLTFRRKPKWSWVLEKRWEAACEKEKLIRKDLDKLPEFNQEKYDSLIKKADSEADINRHLEIISEMQLYFDIINKRKETWIKIDMQIKKTDKIWKQLESAWEQEKNDQ